MRYVWDREARKWVEKPRSRGALGVQIIHDSMDGVRSMADGKWHDSKSTLRRGYKEGGFEEIGNERLSAPEYEPPSAVDDIRVALQQRGYE